MTDRDYPTRPPRPDEEYAEQKPPHPNDPDCEHPDIVRRPSTNGYYDRCTRCGLVLSEFEYDW